MDLDIELLSIISKISNFPQKDREEIEEFIEYSEYGIALENICSVIEQEKLNINILIYNKIKELGMYMELDHELWNCILGLIS